MKKIMIFSFFVLSLSIQSQRKKTSILPKKTDTIFYVNNRNEKCLFVGVDAFYVNYLKKIHKSYNDITLSQFRAFLKVREIENERLFLQTRNKDISYDDRELKKISYGLKKIIIDYQNQKTQLYKLYLSVLKKLNRRRVFLSKERFVQNFLRNTEGRHDYASFVKCSY